MVLNYLSSITGIPGEDKKTGKGAYFVFKKNIYMNIKHVLPSDPESESETVVVVATVVFTVSFVTTGNEKQNRPSRDIWLNGN